MVIQSLLANMQNLTQQQQQEYLTLVNEQLLRAT